MIFRWKMILERRTPKIGIKSDPSKLKLIKRLKTFASYLFANKLKISKPQPKCTGSHKKMYFVQRS